MGIKLIKPENNLQLQAKDKEQLTFKQEKVLKGDPGDSAYDIAIANGFEGSEQEWLKSLEGAPGQTGPTGAPGKDGRDGVDGKDGYTPIKGIDYFDGEPGIDGADGAPGEDGKDGISVTVAAVVESTIDGGFNVVTFSDGKTLNIKNGNKGADGKDGAPGEAGYTPVKGVDYFDGEPGKDGAPGAPGKDGYTPQKGIDYFDGEPGKDGAPGKDGSDGADGYTPIKGVDYFDGEPGAQGIQGEPGKDGYTPVKGVDYFDGEPGAPGKDGKDGVDGKDGYTPVKGVDYFDGVDGKDGADGKDGYTPVKGVDYFDGKDGKDGVDGKNGTDGKNGVDGKGAYQYAQDGGYTGSETEFSAKLATPFVTPQMFKASTDKDDTAALQRALAASDTVYLPSGQYVITEPIDLSAGKKLFSNNRSGTIVYKGTGSVFYLGKRTMIDGITVRVASTGVDAVFNTDNRIFPSSTSSLLTEVNNIEVNFEAVNKEATLINIIASNKDYKKVSGLHNQHYSNIQVEGNGTIGYGIKICTSFDNPYEAGVTGALPWITNLRFNHIWLGSPQCGIKIHRENNSGTEIDYPSIVTMEHMMFTDIASQYTSQYDGHTKKFYEVEWCMAEFINCQPWDYHHVTNAGKKYNTIGQGALLSEVNARRSPIDAAEFPSVTGVTPEEDPAFFLDKFFNFQSNIDDKYGSVDMKIDKALASMEIDEAVIESIAQNVIDEAMSGIYYNLMSDERTQVKVKQRFSNSSQQWTSCDSNDALIIPIQTGTNLVRWLGNSLSSAYMTVFLHNDLSAGTYVEESNKLVVTNGDDTYLRIDNPAGYQYASIPFVHTAVTMNADNMAVTINQLIKESSLSYVSEHLNNAHIHVTAAEKDSWNNKMDAANTEEWTFTLADGSTVTKKVVLA